MDVTLHTDSGVDAEWDAFVAATPGGSHVQTSRWAEVKAVQEWSGERVIARVAGRIVGGCQLLLRRTGPVTMAYAPRAPLLGVEAEDLFPALLEGIRELTAQHRLSYVKVQPPPGREDVADRLVGEGFVESDLEAAPIATTLVDLAAEPAAILAGMRSGTRANVRKAQRKGVTVRTAGIDEIDRFGALVQATSVRQRFAPYPIPYYRRMLELFGDDGQATLLFAEHQGRVLSGLLVLGWNDTATYKMGAWSGEPGPVHPNELAHWTAMCWAREHGYRWYDLEGLPVALAQSLARGEPWPDGERGTAWFKLGFGGAICLFPGAYDFSPSAMLAPVVRRAAPRLRRWESLALRALGRGR
jgi:lipid II:glycine glycyltransferase (peptidoglycan interpeptide bridge formation enzyme)